MREGLHPGGQLGDQPPKGVKVFPEHLGAQVLSLYLGVGMLQGA